VMYVLKHADKPEIYAGLPADPHISPLVGLWKGALKPVSLLLMGLTALAGFFHYVKVGPNDADEDAEKSDSSATR
jgi:formate dehydrogenase iron-sulfur subunit